MSMGRNLFNSVKLTRPKTSNFDLTHDVKLTMKMGPLYPIMHMDCVPGDKINVSCESLIRFMPMTAPVMHRIDSYIHYFFVPYRILWPNWEDWLTGRNQGTTNHPLPYFTYDQSAASQVKSVSDYLGLPVRPGVTFLQIQGFAHAAYQRIWSEYYRDQNLSNPGVDMDKWGELADGNNDSQYTATFNTLRTRCWEHDYFTSCLPYAQQGAQSVDVPLGDVTITHHAQVRRDSATGSTQWTATQGATPVTVPNVPESGTSNIPADGLYAYVNGQFPVEPTTINELRSAFRLQEWLERNIVGGQRYIEHILAHFGVKSPDARLQRPEYITGAKSPVVISEVLNTTGTLDDGTTQTGDPQGTMAGHGLGVGSGGGKPYFVTEHGIMMGIMSILPKTSYFTGIDRWFLKKSPLDYYYPEFANLGEQAVYNAEVVASHATPNGTFGYVPRYAEYKFMNNRITGQMRDTYLHWHLGRSLVNNTSLNSSFIHANPSNRIFAVQDDSDYIIATVLNKVYARRPMPKYGTPRI